MRRFLIAAALAVALTPIDTMTAGADASVRDGLQAARAATARYHSLEQARRDGYTTEGEPCISAPPPPELSGAMGIHAVNPALVGDGVLDPLRPESCSICRTPKASSGSSASSTSRWLP
jgi:hypothetical protein